MMHISENCLRVAAIEEFISLYDRHRASPVDDDLRNAVSRKTPEIAGYVRAAGLSTVVGAGVVGPYDLFENILEPLHAEPARIRDRLHSALGVYEYRHKQWKRNMINPLYWAGEIIRIPFHIMKFAGFNIERLESNWLGKIYKSFMGLLVIVIAIFTVLEFVGVDTKIFSQDRATQKQERTK